MRNFKIRIRSFILASMFGLCLPGTVHAAGFALIEVNATGQGNAYAGAAVGTNNASTIFFNPAGMMNFAGDQLVIAGHLIAPKADFSNDGSTLSDLYITNPPASGFALTGDEDDGGQSAFVPNLYWTKEINESLKFGLGFNAPFGLAVEYDEDWVGRYHAVESDLMTVNINPSLAYRVNDRVVVGGGLNIMLANVILTSAVDMGSVCIAAVLQQGQPLAIALALCQTDPDGPGGPQTEAVPQQFDGFADLTGDNYDDLGVGYNLGVTFAVSKQTKIGISYRSEIEINVEGEADFTTPDTNPTVNTVVATGLFTDTDIEATVDLPASFSVSIAHTAGKFTWLADITRTEWSSFEELRIEYDSIQPDTVTTEAWDDSNRYSVGLDFQYSDKMILRTGVALDETPVPSAELRTPRLPGNERTWISFGLTYLINPQMSVDVGYSHLFIDDAKIDNEFESSVSTLNATLIGEYEASVDILSAQLNWTIK